MPHELTDEEKNAIDIQLNATKAERYLLALMTIRLICNEHIGSHTGFEHIRRIVDSARDCCKDPSEVS